jgi:cyanophycinase
MNSDPSSGHAPLREARRAGPFWIISLTILCLASLVSWFGGNWAARLDSSQEADFLSRFRGGVVGGTLLIAGGGDLPAIIQQRFFELAGGKKSRLVIIPAYYATPSDIARLKADWRNWRFASVQVLQARNREEAERPEFSEPLRNATAVWLSGGEQSWLADLYCETDTEKRLQELLERGGIIGGTSAGAAIMTRVMIEEGRKEPKLRRGLDLFQDAVIDQHFFRRNRMQRLARTLKRQPELIGFGIDEETALVVQVQRGRLGVIGKSYVMACIPEPESDSLRLEVLKPGDIIEIDELRDEDSTSAVSEPSIESEQQCIC